MAAYGLLAIHGKEVDLRHLAHCFDYIRQSILCAADTTIEGSTNYGEGWGARHQCKDIEAIKAWANDNSVLLEHFNSDGHF